MRIDKFLKVSRILKRRSVGKDACDGNRVTINGKTAKPSTEVSVGDVVSLQLGSGEISFKVLLLLEFCKGNDYEKMYEVLPKEANFVK